MRLGILCAVLGVLGASCSRQKSGPLADAGSISRGSAPVPTIEEVEPNDRIEQATPIPIGQPVRGTLARTGKRPDVDHFKIVVREPRGLLRAEVTGIPGIDIGLSVVRLAPPRELAKADRGAVGLGKVIPNVGVTPGEYAVVVRHLSGTTDNPDSPYTLTVQVTPAKEDDELEPNDVRADAQEMEAGKAMRGYFGKKWDRDWYKLKLPDLQADHTARVELTGAGTTYASLEILDEIEAPLKKGRARSMGVLFPNLHIKPGQKILYLVASGGRQPNATERYSLQVTLEKMVGVQEREPNDTPPRATKITAGEAVKGFIAPAGDEDWYALEVAAPSLARISVTGIDNVDLVLGLHDQSGLHRLSVDEGKVREGEILPNAPLAAGRNLIRVSAKKTNQENVFQPYELLAEVRPDDGLEEQEPNNDLPRANPIAIGTPREGYLYPKRDVDVYRLDLQSATAPRALRFALRGIPKVRPVMLLKSAQGAVLAQAGPKAPEESLSFDKELAPGLYYVEVQGGESSNPRDRYELKVSGP
jgi:hypothetical protein